MPPASSNVLVFLKTEIRAVTRRKNLKLTTRTGLAFSRLRISKFNTRTIVQNRWFLESKAQSTRNLCRLHPLVRVRWSFFIGPERGKTGKVNLREAVKFYCVYRKIRPRILFSFSFSNLEIGSKKAPTKSNIFQKMKLLKKTPALPEKLLSVQFEC